jgi:hypothetical protein
MPSMGMGLAWAWSWIRMWILLDQDGYNAYFFKHSWNIICPDIIEAVQEFFPNDKLLTKLSVTCLALVPKIENASVPVDFRPIACCNTLYKCMPKVLAARLKQVQRAIISSSQGTFVQERQIQHNIITMPGAS